MKAFFTLVSPLLLTLTAATAAAQTPEMPPIKMGLWQSETTTSTDANAAANPVARAFGNRTTVTQGCLTPESWKNDLQNMQNRQKRDNCTQSNFEQDSHHVAFDEKCTNQGGYASDVHFEMLIDDTENAHGHGDIKMTGPAFPSGMTMHMTTKTKYMGSDCGSVKPGEGKVIQ
jgi:hypothetical protein